LTPAREASSLPSMKCLISLCLLLACGAAVAAPSSIGAAASMSQEAAPLALPRVLTFDTDVYKLTAEHRRLLARHAENLRADRRLRLVVEANADDAKGAPDYDQALADKRAETVIKVLVSLGVEPYQLEARAVGKPRAKARRVELIYR
jgi:outer membrane protein OmpA-like peptidoglycan-associated protein